MQTRNTMNSSTKRYRLRKTKPVNYDETTNTLNQLSLSIYNRAYKIKLQLNDTASVNSTAIFGKTNHATIRQVYEGLFDYINSNQLQTTPSTITLDNNLRSFFGVNDDTMNLYTMHRYLAQYRTENITNNTTNTNTTNTNTNIQLNLNANDVDNSNLRTRYFTRSTTNNLANYTLNNSVYNTRRSQNNILSYA